MNVVEIFDSIDGEGIFAGQLATFIRLAGCNLRCRYCDTGYAMQHDAGQEMSIEEITARVHEIGNKHVTLTGGEPLIHKDVDKLINKLSSHGCIINIETNGSADVSPYISKNTVVTLDYKTSGSGEECRMLLDNWEKLRNTDVLKMVCYQEDLSSIEEVLETHKTKAQIFLSPVYGETSPNLLVEFIKKLRDKHGIKGVGVQLQMHKYIWDPRERGV